MTGRELANAILKFKGKVFVTANFTEETYVQIVKTDLAAHFKRKGNVETGLKLNEYTGQAFVSMDFEMAFAEVEKELAERRY